MNKKALVILSGGQDSATCLALAKRKYSEVGAISFKYNQRHEIELEMAAKLCAMFDISFHEVIELDMFKHMSAESYLLNMADDIEVSGEVPNTEVPMRNAIFLTIAYGVAKRLNFDKVIIGVSQVDNSGYTDCSLEFITRLQFALTKGYPSEKEILFETPLIHFNKADSFLIADSLGCLDVIINHTLTCYNGDYHTINEWGLGCGTCPACELRKNGFSNYLKFKERYENE